jgi:hypothetical protein
MGRRRDVSWATWLRGCALIASVLVLVAACAAGSQTGSETHWVRCTVTTDCASGHVCRSGACVKSTNDATDAGATLASSATHDAAARAASGGSESARSPALTGSGGATAASAPQGSKGCTSNDLPLAFAPDMYSAYIPGNTPLFQLPVTVTGVSTSAVEWTASDPSMVQIDFTQQSGVMMLTMLKAGDVIITANAGGRCGSSTLHITAATQAQWEAGNLRYNNGNPLPVIPTDGGIPTSFTNYVLDPPGMPPACTNCHGETATSNVFRTSSETPEQTGGYSDQALVQIITQGAVPMNSQTTIPTFLWSFFHKWSDITGDQAQNAVVYLRSLAPESVGGRGDFNGTASK